MTFTLPQLPYALDALKPAISPETLEFHHGKHHKAYLDKLNALIADTKFADQSLEEIIGEAEGNIYNNAAQAWNHAFYWQSLTPHSSMQPTGMLSSAIDSDFSSFANFKKQFVASATENFGSGWTWLVKDKTNGKLSILNTSNAATPITNDLLLPILTVDVWEHAYYIDYRNARVNYLESLWPIINWDFANLNFMRSKP